MVSVKKQEWLNFNVVQRVQDMTYQAIEICHLLHVLSENNLHCVVVIV